jgi:uncharacterized protein
MGHCDSSAQFSRHVEVSSAGSGVAGAAAARGEAQPAGALAKSAKSLGAWTLLFLIRLYMWLLAPFVGGACKFYPSCSNYAYEAIARHGARHGSVLAVKRLLRCRPFTQGGFDPVPEELQGVKPPPGGGARFAAESTTHKQSSEPAAGFRGTELRL